MPRDVQAIDAPEARSALQVAGERFQHMTRRFRDDAHVPVGQVHRVPDDPEPSRAALRELPKPNPLHGPFHEHLHPHRTTPGVVTTTTHLHSHYRSDLSRSMVDKHSREAAASSAL
jgi:hypothetical protein